MHVAAVLAHDVIHRGRVPRSRLGRLLLAEVDAELVLICRGAALLVGRPRVRFIAAADDAVVARDVELLGVLRDDRETVNLTLVSHDDFSSQHVGQAAVQKLVNAFGVDFALAVDAQHVLRKILRGLTPDLLATGLAVEARVMPGAVHCFIRGVVIERKSLVRTGRRETHNVTIGADATGYALAELEQNARRVRIRIRDSERLVRLEIGDIGKAVGRVVNSRRSRRGLGLTRYHGCDRRSCGSKACAAQESATAGINHLIAMAHGRSPRTRRYAYRRGFLKDAAGTPTGRASLFLEVRSLDRHGPVSICRDVSICSLMEMFWFVTCRSYKHA